jgi:ubiquinol-cytochrome c reductase cytochrome c1 subunit
MRARFVLATALLAALTAAPALAQEEAPPPLPHEKWSFAGPFGTYDRAAAQRGFQVYHDICSTCHSLKHAYYRNLEGIGLNEEQVAAIASNDQVASLTDDGQPTTRAGLPSDHFRAPYPNDAAARAVHNGALPPDLSEIINAREGGPDYVYALLTGYSDPPANMKMGDGMNYNKFFPGHQIAMPQPIHDQQVTYGDGTPASVNQMAHDVVTFLAYIANPEMEVRKNTGVKVVLFLVFLTGLTYAVKRKVWADVDH